MGNYTAIYAEGDIAEATISTLVKMLITVSTLLTILVVVVLVKWIRKSYKS